MSLLQLLNDRGLIFQLTDEQAVSDILDKPPISFYVGFDPTAGSLHLGHLVPIMIAKYLQNAGHKPHILIGDGTALIGDPSGRSTERTYESVETIEEWACYIGKQMKTLLDFEDSTSGAVLLQNSCWLSNLNYIDFLRDIGKHFSVNRMLSAESVKLRLETGLSFLEFNYAILQSYDFLHLYRNNNCKLQIGGSDQWGNIVAGIDLIRRKEAAETFGFTCPLVTTSSGEKMSKSQPGGAVWLDPTLTSPYDYFQFWINVDDKDALHFMKLYTFLSLSEISEYESFEGADIRKTKSRLAFEATAIVHGIEEAEKARKASESLFGGKGDVKEVPSMNMDISRLDEGVSYLDLFVETGLCPSRSEVRRLGKQGGLYINDKRITDAMQQLSKSDFDDGSILLRTGKKRYYRIKLGTEE